MKKLFTLIALALLATTFLPKAFAQEGAAATKAISDANKTLIGTWNWTESSFASRGVKPTAKTPASTKTNVSITFKTGNLASLYVNKKFSGTYQYTLTKPMNENLMIRFKANEGKELPEYLQEGPLYLANNELTISGGYNDAGQNVKFRKAGTETKQAVKKTTTTKARK